MFNNISFNTLKTEVVNIYCDPLNIFQLAVVLVV